jgi:hypothetical protein
MKPRIGDEGPGEYNYSFTLSLTSTLDGVVGQCQALAELPPGKGPGTRCTGGSVGPRAALDELGESCAHRN